MVRDSLSVASLPSFKPKQTLEEVVQQRAAPRGFVGNFARQEVSDFHRSFLRQGSRPPSRGASHMDASSKTYHGPQMGFDARPATSQELYPNAYGQGYPAFLPPRATTSLSHYEQHQRQSPQPQQMLNSTMIPTPGAHSMRYPGMMPYQFSPAPSPGPGRPYSQFSIHQDSGFNRFANPRASPSLQQSVSGVASPYRSPSRAGYVSRGQTPANQMLSHLQDTCFDISERLSRLEMHSVLDGSEDNLNCSPSFGHMKHIGHAFFSQFERFQTPVEQTLNNIRKLLGEDREQNMIKAAIVIQKNVRMWRTKRRKETAVWALHSWQRDRHPEIRACFLKWIHKREELEHSVMVFVRIHRKLVRNQCWGFWWEKVLLSREQDKQAMKFFKIQQMKRDQKRSKVLLDRWKAAAFGPRNRKALYAAYIRRREAAKEKLETLALSNGWKGTITQEMIVRELTNQSLIIARDRREERIRRGVWKEWKRTVYVSLIIRGKLGKSSNMFRKALLTRCFDSMVELVTAKKAKMGPDWERRSLHYQARKRHRKVVLRRYIQQWSEIVRVTKKQRS